MRTARSAGISGDGDIRREYQVRLRAGCAELRRVDHHDVTGPIDPPRPGPWEPTPYVIWEAVSEDPKWSDVEVED